MDFVTIADPDKPGDYLVLAKNAFDPAVHTLLGPAVASDPVAPEPAAGPDAPAEAPVSVADLTVAQAIPIIEAATTADAVQALQAQESARPTPRTGVLKALQAKLDALTAAV